jgi:hydrogenase/urease accessory protein HupE
MKFILTLMLFIINTIINTAAFAHEVRPSYLELVQIDATTYQTLWKVPAKGNLRIGLYVVFEEDVVDVSNPIEGFSGGSYTKRWQISHSKALINTRITIKGLQSSFTEALVRIERLDGTVQVSRLMPEKPWLIVEETPSAFNVAKTYTGLGIKHILLGFDHLLFLLCLLFIAGSGKRILITITGFTLAHSLTLVLSALNIVNLSIAPVEAIIALSIVFLATEIAKGRRNTLTWRYPVAVSASFGLLHGFGFAAVLNEIGLPQTELATGLLFFNVGVEIGQLLFIFLVMVLFKATVSLLTKVKAVNGFNYTNMPLFLLQKPTAYTIGILASYWLVERSISFL